MEVWKTRMVVWAPMRKPKHLLGEVGGGVWKARVILSAQLRGQKQTVGMVEGLEDPNDSLGPDEMAKNLCLGR